MNQNQAKTIRCARYLRVSTTDQRTDRQEDDTREFVLRRAWTLTDSFVDHVSGAREKRPALDRLMAAARRREIDTVVVASFDRFARSTRHLLAALDEFSALGVNFVSLREQIDTSTPLGRTVFVIVAAVAELERDLIRERVRSGLAAARRRGARIGRPPVQVDLPRALALRASGKSLREVARVLGIGAATLHRALQAADGGVPETPAQPASEPSEITKAA
ncbi:MAG: recombinase family protein [Deltaproteobacteria bacterium]|nr:recombinase family protein [Deltaproteobacteria bacterium]